MNRTCLLCGCLCLTGLTVSGRMICCGCESALLQRRRHAVPMPGLLAFYRDLPELTVGRTHDETAK